MVVIRHGFETGHLQPVGSVHNQGEFFRIKRPHLPDDRHPPPTNFYITIQNDEKFFRQFICGFVNIWSNQLNLNLDNCAVPKDIKFDQGPHIKRLPDELIPAIQKFLIIAKTNVVAKVSSRVTLL